MHDYIKQAAVTCSDEYHGDLVPLGTFNHALGEFMKAGNGLDTIKKSLFYGRGNAFSWKIGKEPDCSQAASKVTQDVMHGVLGVATEAVELIEALVKGTFDPVNIKEEVGDIFWYCAILARSCGFTFDEAQETNIAKLRERFSEKFNAYEANNRNLAREREILETQKLAELAND